MTASRGKSGKKNLPPKAGSVFSTWVPSEAERNEMVRVAAYFMAEHDGFKGDQQEYWSAAQEHVRLMLALKENQEKLQFILDTALDSVVLMNVSGQIVFWNKRAESMFGWKREEAVGRPLHEILIPARDREAHIQGLARFLQSGQGKMLGQRVEAMAQHHDGHEIPVEISMVPIKVEGAYEFSAFIRDISDRKRMEEQLRESEARWKFALEVSGDGMWDWNIKTGEVLFSRRLKIMLGMDGDRDGHEQLGTWEERIHPEDRAQVMAGVWACADGSKQHYVCEYRLACPDDDDEDCWRWMLARGMAVSRAADGKAMRIIVTHTDISELKAVEEHERHLAQHDVLTNLPNRALFSDRLQQALAVARREKSRLAVLFLDLDKFKPVNDKFGHAVGDLLLKEVAHRMQECVRESDTVARIGGDEFVILLPTVEQAEDALIVAEKIRFALDQAFYLAGEHIYISSSTGIAIHPEHGSDEIQLAKNADAAMYRAKAEGRDRVVLYRPGLD